MASSRQLFGVLLILFGIFALRPDASASDAGKPSVLQPHPEERRLRRVSKDGPRASWFETAQERLLTMRNMPSVPQNMQATAADLPVYYPLRFGRLGGMLPAN